jgi:Arc/MetJ family transcription regulator
MRILEGDTMPTASRRTHKHFQLDAAKIRRAQKALRTKTETETIERALDRVIEEEHSRRLALEATQRFFRSGIKITDVFGTLDE